jgi:hypothetical protein
MSTVSTYNMCLSPGNVSYGNTTSAIWKGAIRYNAPYGNTTSVFHMAIYHRVTRPVPFTWQCVIRYHSQCYMTMRHTLLGCTGRGTVWHIARWKKPVVVSYHILPCEIHWLCYRMATSVFHLTMYYSIPQPVYFSWQCVMRYHNHCISPGNVLCGTTTSTLVVVPHNTLPGEIHWLWYHITHCQVKYNGCGTA